MRLARRSSEAIRRLVELGLQKGRGGNTLRRRTLIAALVSLSGSASAQSDQEKAYCRQLVDLYRRYVQSGPGRRFDVEATLALEACRKGDPEGIPVLEKKLRENHIAVPGGEFKP